MRIDIALLSLLWLILSKDDAKLINQQLLNYFWQYLRIGASIWNLNDSTHFAFPIVTWNLLNVLLSYVSSWLWKKILYKSGSRVLKFISIQYKSRSNHNCDLADCPWNLNVYSFFSYLLQQISNPYDKYWRHVHINFVPLPFALCYFLHRVVYHMLRLIFFVVSDKILREIFNIFDISFIYNLIYWPPFCCINFCSSFISVNVVNILANCLFVSFFLSLFSYINWDSFVNTFMST